VPVPSKLADSIPAPPGVPKTDRVDQYLAAIAPVLRRVAARVCPRALGVEPREIEQEVRIRLWRARADERNVEVDASYLYRTAATAAIDAIRRVRARREESLDAGGEDGDTTNTSRTLAARDEVARGAELRQALGRALERVAPERRRAVRLHLQGLTTDEIAVALRWTEPKARNAAYRGLADLRRELRALGVASAAD
jgi:RNA polymerase sigma factor (sigma-70 family)